MKSIGVLIKLKVAEKGLTVSEFARRINTNRNNVYDIFKRDSIDTLLLQKISEVLEYNFFLNFIKENSVSEPSANYIKTEAAPENLEKIKTLEKEIAYLKELLNDKSRIILLMEQKHKPKKRVNK